MTAPRTGGSSVNAALLITGSTYITYALGLIVGAVIARRLGPADYGRYAFLVWFTGLLVVVTNHGFTTSGIRFVSEALGQGSQTAAAQVHGYLLKMQRFSALVVVGLFLLAMVWVKPDEWAMSPWFFIGAAVLGTLARAAYVFDISIAKGYGIFSVEAYSTLAVGFLNGAAAVVLALLDASLLSFVALFAAAGMSMCVMAKAQLRRARVRADFTRLDPTKMLEVRRHLMWTSLLVLVAVLGGRSIETFTLSVYLSPAHLGFFTLAGGLARGSIDLLTVGLSTVLMPAMGRAFGAGGKPRVHVIFNDSLRYFACIGLMLAGIGVFWSSSLVSIMYGKQYVSVIPILATFQIIGGLTLGEAACGSLLATTGNQSTWAKVSCLSLIVSAILAPLLIKQYGVTGAVVSVATARVLTFGVLLGVVIRGQAVALPGKALRRLCAAAALAALVAAPAALFLPALPGHIMAGFIYLSVFAALSVIFRAWLPADADLLLAVSKRFPRALKAFAPALRRWRSRLGSEADP
ncbi:MAG: oligosaccharide flippase family protein [Pseudomonadota bacterium]